MTAHRPHAAPPPHRRRRAPRRALATLALALATLSCGGTAVAPPVLVVGVDGFEWDLLLELLHAGELPTIAGLMDRGSYGLLETGRPTFSPIIWTSIATGKTPAEHGIHGFTRRADEGGRRLYNSFDRRSKAFWNILSDYDRSVAVVGWWMTYPAEPVNGVMVAQVNTLDQARRKEGQAILKGGLMDGIEGQVYPAERLDEYLGIHDQIERTLDERTRQIFGEFEHPLGRLARRLWQNTTWAFRADATYVEIADRLAAERFDVVAFYLGGADVAGHRFWRHMRPRGYRSRPPEDEVDDLAGVILDYYRYIDREIGRVLARMPKSTRVVVLSDHGMHAVNRRKTFDSDSLPKDINSGHHRDAPPGVLLLSGPGIRRGSEGAWKTLHRDDLPTLGSVLDVTPTLLAMLGVPVGEDMSGRVLRRVLEDGDDLALDTVASHDDEAWRAARAGLDPDRLADDEERLEQLRALGYIN